MIRRHHVPHIDAFTPQDSAGAHRPKPARAVTEEQRKESIVLSSKPIHVE